MEGKTLRFTNFVIDTLFYLVLITIFIWVFRNIIPREDIKWISALVYFAYYFFFEAIGGQTPGKFITRSKVALLHREKGFFYFRVFFRTLMRFLPVDLLSHLFSFRGLHDRISKTTITKL